MNVRVVVIIQARMASSRLPGKVLMDIEGVPMLSRVVERTREAKTAADVVLATSTEDADDAIVEYCHGKGICSIRGSHYDVLERYHDAAREVKADIVVRITADCPLIDAGLIDEAVHVLLGTGKTNIKDKVPIGVDFDFVADRLPPPWKRTYPIGLDVEVCTREALDRAWREAEAPVDREHVMPYMYRGVVLEGSDTRLSTGRSPQGFRVAVLNSPYDYGSYRWTVDTADDLEFVRQIYRCFRGRSDFSWIDVLSIVHTHPEIVSINASIRHKSLEETDERTAGAES